MATAFGPEAVHGASLPPMDPNSFLSGGDQHFAQQPRAAPPPNPVFSFPARPDPSDDQDRDDEPAPPRPARRRPISAIEGTIPPYKLAAERAESRAALPQFSFNPGATLSPEPQDGSLSPPRPSHSPRTASMSASRPTGHGHRRGGSEFVGGRIREGNSIAVMSGSPTKLEADLEPINIPQHPSRRRGHRRGVSSAAISVSDLNLPLPNPSFSFGGSAPTSPTTYEHDQGPQPLEVPGTPSSEHSTATEPATHEFNVPNDPPPARASTSRARVGFSDTLEYIPRPLSLVSTDTSSTVTVRPGHSVSGSVSSFVTAPTGRDSPIVSYSPTPTTAPSRDASRPSTAGAILERTPTLQADEPDVSPRRRNSIPALADFGEPGDVSMPEPSPTKSKRWTFFGFDHFSNHTSQYRTRPSSSCSVDSATRVPTGSSSEHSESQDDLKQPRKKNKRRKMVKGWADSILPRIPKRSKYSVRPPTPPPSGALPDEEEEEPMPEADAPLSSPQPPAQQQQPITPTLTITESPDLPQQRRSPADEVSSPMIDLDAALGPFNTPLPHNAEWDAAQQAAGNAGRRRLHSAQGMRGFTGPGMHYHRRAESAPNLPPFDMGRAAMSRFGSSSTMADVFEEDEEEDDGERRGSSQAVSVFTDDSDGETTPPAVITTAPPLQPAPATRRRGSSGVSDNDRMSLRASRSGQSLQERVIVEEPPRSAGLAPSSSDISLSPRQSLRSMAPPPPPTREIPPAMELGLPTAGSGTPISPYSTSFASSPRSPMSADTQRLSTAPSSVNEDNSFQSLLMGEPGPEVRLSVDYDIPSLTSSTSATTRDSTGFLSQARMSLPRAREPRPLSVSSGAFGRRRSSLVSLSRLISSSHGERSKLSMEVPMDNDKNEAQADGKRGKSKSKRLGRLVQFWKTKDGA